MTALLLVLALGRMPAPVRAAGQSAEPEPTLAAIAADIDARRGMVITMTMRLKYFDDEIWRILFYDENNHDIVFDISAKDDKKRLVRDLKCIHEGLRYRVTFKVTGKSALGVVEGSLQGFRPVFLEKIPWPE